MIRRAIVNVAVGAWYPAGQQRLFDSIEERRENATRLFWRDSYPPSSPGHDAAPYAFKPYALEEARHLGFDQALWIDSSAWAIKPLDTIWSRITDTGWWLEPDGHIVGEWIGDHALRVLRLDRDQLLNTPLIEGKLIGLDFRNDVANRFLDEWLKAADDGAFSGHWTNEGGQASSDARCRGHRHDIACGSPIAERLGMTMQGRKAVGFPANGDPGDEILFFAQGL